jgi:hypothetical protein
MIDTEEKYWSNRTNYEEIRHQIYSDELYCNLRKPSIIYKPNISKDGNQWCVLYGKDLHDGVCGFGDTPQEAMDNFDTNWDTKENKKQ